MIARFPYRDRITHENVGDFLLFAAKHSQRIRVALVKALVAPESWFPRTPQIPDRNLVKAIRVADLAASRLGYDTPGQRAWVELRGRLLDVLRLQTRAPLLAADVIRAKPTLESVAQYFQLNWRIFENDLHLIEKERDFLKKLEEELLQRGSSKQAATERLRQVRDSLRGKVTRQSQRGRRFDEHDQRMIAAILLLVHCGTTKEQARQQVASALYEWSKKLEADSLKALEARYRKTGKFTKLSTLGDPQKYRKMGSDPEAVVSTANGRADALIPPESLPGFWLERLGWFLMDRSVRDNPPRFVADLLGEKLKGEWRQIRREFSATANSLV